MNDSLEKTLLDALCAVNLPELPPVWNEEDVFLHAIVKVRKADNSEAYGLMSKNIEAEDNITQIFGSVCYIKQIISIHPYTFLESKYMPETKGKAEKMEYLRKFFNLPTTEPFESMKLGELNKEILKTAIIRQLKNDAYKKDNQNG